MQAKCGGGAGRGHTVRLRLQRTQASTGIPFCRRLQRPGWKGRAMLLVRVLPSVAFVAAMLCAATLAADAAETAKQTDQIDLTQWPLGDIASVRDDPFGVLVKYGYTLSPTRRTRSAQGWQTRRGVLRVTISLAVTATCRPAASHTQCRWLASGASFRNI